MCITSAECKTVITAMLMVMSGMDPHIVMLMVLSSNHRSTQTCLHHYLDGIEDWNQEFQQNPEDDC
jgi:hypothetical protein